MIFLGVRDGCRIRQHTSLGLEANPRDSDHWLQVTRVCRAWRSVAMDYAPLWSTFRLRRNCSYQDETEKFSVYLANSRLSPLSIESVYALTTSAQAQLVENVYRLQKLQLRGTLDPKDLLLLSTQDAPKLEAFELYASQKDEKIELPTLFNNIHQLKTLALTGFTRMAHNSFTHLQNLYLAYQKYTSLDDIGRFLDLLGNLSLEQLMFSHTSVTVAISPSQLTDFSRRAIVLPVLQRIVFAGTATAFVNVILSAASVPAGQTLAILLAGWGSDARRTSSNVDLLEGPGWETICQSTERFSVRNGSEVILHSAGRELNFIARNESLDALSTAFREAIRHASEVWICNDLAKHHPEDVLGAFLSHTSSASVIYLDIPVPRAGNIFELLHGKDADHDDTDMPRYLPLADNDTETATELHVKVISERPKAFSQIRAFREAVSNCDGTRYITDIHVYTGECKESLKLKSSSEKVHRRKAKSNPVIHVMTDDGKSLPKIASSPAFWAPCPFQWDSGYGYW